MTTHDSEMYRLAQTLRAHSQAYGALCRDGGDGCCADCGVGLDTCDRCDGIGYHKPTCPEMKDVT